MFSVHTTAQNIQLQISRTTVLYNMYNYNRKLVEISHISQILPQLSTAASSRESIHISMHLVSAQ